MTIERIKEIQSKTAYPESVSVQQALLQVWNECKQEQLGIGAVSGAELDMWKMLNQINVIMWESYMIKDGPFGRNEGHKIMEVLKQWADHSL